MSGITTHILDVSRGKPAANVGVTLLKETGPNSYSVVSRASTDADGRAKSLVASDEKIEAGNYRLHFQTATYFESLGVTSFYPYVEISFTIRAPHEHHHVPLLLSPFGYSTYRGS